MMTPSNVTRAATSPRTVSAVIPTIDRPDALRTCLEHLDAQTTPPDEVIVVDASAGVDSRRVCDDFPGIVYLRNESGLGSLSESRQIGYEHATGDVIAYLDDDAYAEPQWCSEILAGYDADDVGAVCGRVLMPDPFPPPAAPEQIGRLYPDGSLTGNFYADAPSRIDVDHAMGANMSYRRDVIDLIGGVPQIKGGNSNHHEDLAFSLAIRSAGYRIRFAPRAAVLHVGAPQPVGRRFDVRYDFFANRNMVLVLAGAYGADAPETRAAIRTYLRAAGVDTVRKLAGAFVHGGARVAGLASGWREARRQRARRSG